MTQDDQRPRRVRIELPTWLTLLIVALTLILGAVALESVLDNASDARQGVEERY